MLEGASCATEGRIPTTNFLEPKNSIVFVMDFACHTALDANSSARESQRNKKRESARQRNKKRESARQRNKKRSKLDNESAILVREELLRMRLGLAPLPPALLLLLLVCARSSGGQIVNVTQTRDWRSTASEHFSRGSSTHSSNWAIIASTSIFWYNYRHTANALAVYRAVKNMGLDDDHIILMLADDHACNPRNAFQGQVFSDTGHTDDLCVALRRQCNFVTS
jgi:hypothetical protein